MPFSSVIRSPDYLPITAWRQQIMGAIRWNLVLNLAGVKGSGRTVLQRGGGDDGRLFWVFAEKSEIDHFSKK
jgi:hypothetical protein